MKIRKIFAQEILDSRGEPTVKVWVTLENGAMGDASVPSGASTGVHEAVELRDGDKKRYGGKGVLKAVKNVNTVIAKKLHGMGVENLRAIDNVMIKLDGTANKSKLGANAILGVSLACAHAGAYGSGMPLFRWIRKIYPLPLIPSHEGRGKLGARSLRKGSGKSGSDYRLPTPLMNVFNGGLHADTNLDFQEFMIVPHGFGSIRNKVRVGAEVYHALGRVLKRAGKDTDLGAEGGYAPRVELDEDPLSYIMKAIQEAGYKAGTQVSIGLDLAASEYYNSKKKMYRLELTKKKWHTASDMAKIYQHLMRKYPIFSLEDIFAEDDWGSWVKFNAECRMKNEGLLVIGDDLYTTNVERLRKGIVLGATNAILIKPNQIGTLSETVDAIQLAQKHKMKVIISHRSGETSDTTIADLAVAVNAEYIKAGAPSRGERVAKYDRLMEIEQELRSG